MTTLTETINTQLQAHHDQPYIKELATATWYTGGDIAAARNQLRTHLEELGVTAGDLILISLPNSTAHIVALLAAFELHAVAYTVNPRMPAPELAEIIGRHHYAAAILNAEHAQQLTQLEQLSSSRFQANATALFGDTLSLFTFTEQSVTSNDLITDFAAQESSPLGVLMYTSGTTGLPKAVVLTHEQLLAAAYDIAQSQALTADDISLLVLPLFHINAQVISLLATLVSGGKMVVAPKFSASRFWPTVTNDRITWVSAAPAIIAILLQTKPQVAPTCPQLRFVRSASAPLLPVVEREFTESFGVPIVQGYGMTEAASQIALNPIGASKPGSVGIATGTDLVIMSDLETPLRAGEIGEICLRGTHVIHGYLDPQYAQDFTGGWFHTGDVGYVDADGYLFIVGRKKELINHSGDKVSPAEVENVLIQHPAVRSIAVIGLPDAIYGESVAAVVILEPGYAGNTEQSTALQDFAGAMLAKFKVPTHFYYRDHLAAGATGKIQHTRVRHELMTQLALV